MASLFSGLDAICPRTRVWLSQTWRWSWSGPKPAMSRLTELTGEGNGTLKFLTLHRFVKIFNTSTGSSQHLAASQLEQWWSSSQPWTWYTERTSTQISPGASWHTFKAPEWFCWSIKLQRLLVRLDDIQGQVVKGSMFKGGMGSTCKSTEAKKSSAGETFASRDVRSHPQWAGPNIFVLWTWKCARWYFNICPFGWNGIFVHGTIFTSRSKIISRELVLSHVPTLSFTVSNGQWPLVNIIKWSCWI